MNSIVKANEKDAQLLAKTAALTFIESHGNCAEPADVDLYIAEKYNEAVFKTALADPKNIYHLIYNNGKVAGFSNIILNSPYSNNEINNIAKLERIYILKEFYNLKLGLQLFEFNVNLAKQHKQQGIWLYVWKENERAVSFYTKAGFTIIGSYDFKISEAHSNPNHRMFLKL